MKKIFVVSLLYQDCIKETVGEMLNKYEAIKK